VGTGNNINLYSSAGENTAIIPWLVTPGVVRDLDYPVGRAEYSGWLTDCRDMLVDEVSVSAERGLSLRTLLFSEADLIDLQMQYAEETGEEDYDLGD
jgi:hypothetical protein